MVQHLRSVSARCCKQLRNCIQPPHHHYQHTPVRTSLAYMVQFFRSISARRCTQLRPEPLRVASQRKGVLSQCVDTPRGRREAWYRSLIQRGCEGRGVGQ